MLYVALRHILGALAFLPRILARHHRGNWQWVSQSHKSFRGTVSDKSTLDKGTIKVYSTCLCTYSYQKRALNS